MKICLLGATGRTGKLVLAAALKEGHEVTCLARNTSRIHPQPGLNILEGDTTNEQDLRRSLEGCEGVISVLNVSRNSDFPWSRLRTPPTLLSDTMKILLPLITTLGIQRLVVCSAWGVGETANDIPGWFSWFINNSNIGVAYQDHARQEQLVEASNIPWTIVQPVGLTNSSVKQKVRESFSNEQKPNLTISRRSVAYFLLAALTKPELMSMKVVISKE
ncbi:MAG: NAD(P)-binding oxidoreductase [Cytophagales bacterium]|nr:NAD(P)-binding oxidoreductase [Cytophagales bacterium]